MYWTDLLRQAAISTFEEAAFCLVEGVDGAGAITPSGIDGLVRFEGPCTGVLLVEAEPATASASASNMLGLTELPPLALQRDAVFELANMICGQVVSGVGSGGALFRLSRTSPDVRPAQPPEVDLCLALDCGTARVALWIQKDLEGGAS